MVILRREEKYFISVFSINSLRGLYPNWIQMAFFMKDGRNGGMEEWRERKKKGRKREKEGDLPLLSFNTAEAKVNFRCSIIQF